MLAAAALAAYGVMAAPARATLQLTISDNNSGASPNPLVVNYDSNSDNAGGSFTFDGFTLRLYEFASSFDDRTVTVGAISIRNNNTAASGINSLRIQLSEDQFASPGSFALNLTSQASVTSAPGPVTFQSFAATTLNDQSGFRTPILTIGGNAATSGNTESSGFVPAGPTYSVTTVSTFAINAGQSVQSYGGIATISTPEPATLAMALAGLPMAGILAWSRRRRGMGGATA